MSDTWDLLIKGGTCVMRGPNGHWQEVEIDVAILNRQIVALGHLDEKKSQKVMPAKGLHVLPGLIDTQVHFREPGLEHKETLSSGSAGAVKGGITGVFEMPNTNPSTTSAIAIHDKLTRANGHMWCHHAFYVGATAENAEQLGGLEKLPGVCGVKIFMGSSTGTLLMADEVHLKRVLSNGRRRVAVHCEDEERLKERRHLVDENPGQVALHPVWRDEETALLATQKITRLSQETERPVHVLHVTTKQEMQYLKQLKPSLPHLSVECTPQHLTLAAPECYETLGTYAQMNPPIRDKYHQEAIWQALNDGTVDILGSDHAPHTKEEKQKPYPLSPSGMPGVQTTLPLMLDHIHHGRLTLFRLLELMVENPVRLFGIKDRGAIAVGKCADLTIVDLKAQREITNQWMETRSGWTPFAGMKVHGWPIATIIDGQIVMRDDQILGKPLGQPYEFTETERS
ncbi:MAG: dihydroorotase [Pseudobdellovibrionaceae bacterium]|nr:dihydroorotase [Bdellovibrionales bacterium]USN48823.1 MAG: dihydroorotase [Pseudobdellovibrionaceae bacterium]